MARPGLGRQKGLYGRYVFDPLRYAAGVDPSGDCAFVACQLSNQVAVVEPARQRLLDLIDVATPAA
ncbi:MAG TPA: hypothetical protein VIR57_08630 [Chloroflexota bacterium]|jgi:hypothetical protein